MYRWRYTSVISSMCMAINLQLSMFVALSINNPSMSGDGYIAYPPLEDVSRSTMLEAVIRPTSSEDSLITYIGENKYGTGDYLALLIRNGYVYIWGISLCHSSE